MEQGQTPEQEGKPKINTELLARLKFADDILSGNYGGEFDENSHDPMEVFEGPFIDYNNPELTPIDRGAVDEWLDSRFRDVPPEELAQNTKTFKSSDGLTTFYKYEIPFGQNEDDIWYVSKWQNEGELPSYILWPDWMYDTQEEMGYEEI